MGDQSQGSPESMAEGRSHVSEPAQRLYDLVLDYAERSLASQEELVRAFEAEAAQWTRAVGEVVIGDDDDEHLRLTDEGRFSGRVLDDDTGTWEPVTAPDGVAAHYDPVDLFNDLADALEELFPGLAENAGSEADEDALPDAPEPFEPPTWIGPTEPPTPEPIAPPETAAPAGPFERPQTAAPGWSTPTERDEPAVADGLEPFREQLRALQDLRNAGVLTPAQFEAAKAKLTHR